jgi:membrane protein implicated in regulation of membrane protease activity
MNCGGPLLSTNETSSGSVVEEELPTPPPAPRPISDQYAWRLVARDGGAIAAFVFAILGIVFSLVGAGLTLGIITAFLGIPFLLLGIAFLIAGVWVFVWRYQNAQKVVHVLRGGQARRGQITATEQNYHIRINGRFPWVIRYQFQVDGQDYEGKVSVLNPPGKKYEAGKAAWILFLPDMPKWNSIYPHP